MVQIPLEIHETNSKKRFFWEFIPVSNPLIFWLQLVPGNTIQIQILKTKIVPGTGLPALNTGSYGKGLKFNAKNIFAIILYRVGTDQYNINANFYPSYKYMFSNSPEYYCRSKF